MKYDACFNVIIQSKNKISGNPRKKVHLNMNNKSKHTDLQRTRHLLLARIDEDDNLKERKHLFELEFVRYYILIPP